MKSGELKKRLRLLSDKLNKTYLNITEISPVEIRILLEEAIFLRDVELIFFAEIQLVFIRFDIVSSDVATELEKWVERVEQYGFKKLSFLIRIRLAKRVFVYRSDGEFILLGKSLLQELNSLKLPRDFDLQCRSSIIVDIAQKVSSFFPSYYHSILKKVMQLNLRRNPAAANMAKSMMANHFMLQNRYSQALRLSMSVYSSVPHTFNDMFRFQFDMIAMLTAVDIGNYELAELLSEKYIKEAFKKNYFVLHNNEYSLAFCKLCVKTNQFERARKWLFKYKRWYNRSMGNTPSAMVFDFLYSFFLAETQNYRLALKYKKREYEALRKASFDKDAVVTTCLRSVMDLITEESLPDYCLRQSRRKRRAEIKLWMSLNQKLYHHLVLNGLNDVQSSVYLGSQADQLALTAKFRMLFETAALTSGHVWHSLQDEVSLLRTYCDLMGYKYGFSPGLQVDIPDELLSVGCPYFLLQGVMENAFKHGYHSGLPQFSMQLHVRLVGDSLHLVFTDNGKGMQHLSSKKSGMIGLSTNRQRMEILSAWTGLPAGIEVVNTSSGQISGTSVIIQLPRLASPCRVADYHLFLCKKDEQKFSHSRTDIS